MLSIVDEILVEYHARYSYINFKENSTEFDMSQILKDLANGINVKNIRIRYFGPFPGSLQVIYDTDNGSIDEVVGEDVCEELKQRSGVDYAQYEKYLLEKEANRLANIVGVGEKAKELRDKYPDIHKNPSGNSPT